MIRSNFSMDNIYLVGIHCTAEIEQYRSGAHVELTSDVRGATATARITPLVHLLLFEEYRLSQNPTALRRGTRGYPQEMLVLHQAQTVPRWQFFFLHREAQPIYRESLGSLLRVLRQLCWRAPRGVWP